MAVDLTRFDFNAKSFLHSDNVRAMTFEEIGQYVLLLCESWLTGKECTLPEDPMILRGLCRGARPTNKVLAMFPVVPQLGRRRNERLYMEWLNAVSRSESASERGQRGNEVRWGIAHESPKNRPAMADAIAEESPKPSQANPNQTNPYQGKESNFSNIAIQYRTAMGRGHSKAKQFREKYVDVCSAHGEDAVLGAFSEWAESNVWRKEHLGNTGLRFFFSDVSDLIEERRTVEQMKPKQLSEAEIKVINEAGSEEEYRRRIAPLLEQIAEDEKSAAASRAHPYEC